LCQPVNDLQIIERKVKSAIDTIGYVVQDRRMKTNNELETAIETVKTAKATNCFHELVKEYGTLANCLNALDCRHGTTSERIAEAIATIKIGVKYSIFKRDGKVVIQ
jgi:hypothetical protein